MALLDIFKKRKKKKVKSQPQETQPQDNVVENKGTETEIKNAITPNTVTISKDKTVKSTISESSFENSAKSSNAKESDTKEIAIIKTNARAEQKATAKPNIKIKATPKPVFEEKNEKVAESKGYTGHFEINRSKDGKKFFFNLYASNKVGIATSQMYSTAQSAMNGIKSVIANAAKAPIEDQTLKKYEPLPFPKWEIYIDNGGKYRFRLNASNGNCVCHSQGYTTKTACKNGIDSIIRSSKNADIEKTYIIK